MTIYVIEKQGQREINTAKDTTKDTSKIGYDVFTMDGSTPTDYQLWDAVKAASPDTDGGLIRDEIKLKHVESEVWDATVTYVDPEKAKKDPDIGELVWEGDATGGRQHITQGLAPSKIFAAQNWRPMEFQRAIDVHRTKTGWQVKGTEVVIPKAEFTCTTSFAPNLITLEWWDKVYRMTGKVNNAKWKIWEKGENKFMGARFKARYRERVTMTFTFSASPNITAADNITYGEGALAVGPIEMEGHQVPWVYYIQEEEQAMVLMRPVQCNVETVCLPANFDDLGLGN